ncbi:MAG: hypothetical protein Q9224_006555 [Gallowayella concinna]
MIRYVVTPLAKVRIQRVLSGSLSMRTPPATNNGSPSPAGKYTAETYTRSADHTPQTTQSETKTYILALKTDPAHHQAVTALRNKHFPTKINKLAAHIALFRALPGSKLPAIQKAIQNLVCQTSSFSISTGEPFLMAHGVGLNANVEPAKEIFQTLKEQWNDFLSKQDHGFRPHYTIQNKVEKSVAEETLAEVRNSFGGSEGTVTGLLLYFYDRGYWTLKNVYWFRDGKEEERKPVVDKNDREEWPSLGPSKPLQ